MWGTLKPLLVFEFTCGSKDEKESTTKFPDGHISETTGYLIAGHMQCHNGSADFGQADKNSIGCPIPISSWVRLTICLKVKTSYL